MSARQTADVVVVGGGTVGGWGAYFAATGGAASVVLLEQGVLGGGASSRASGVVRAQGGTPTTVQLGMWTIDFYRRQQATLGVDSGFLETGYLVLAMTKRDIAAGLERVAMQRRTGLDVAWLDAESASELVPTLAQGVHRGGSFTTIEGSIDPPRNVLAYSIAMRQASVQVRERTPLIGLRTIRKRSGAVRVVGVVTPDGVIATERVILTGGPSLRSVGRLFDTVIPVGAARHQVVVTGTHPLLEGPPFPMVFDLGAGIYWRGHEGGLLWGMSNPAEPPGPARAIDWPYLRRMERRLNRLAPITRELGIRKAWAATIDFTPDHLPILGPAITSSGNEIKGTMIACAGGHGMMWGPAVSRIAADLSLEDGTAVADITHLGMDQFDASGRSRLSADPIALPFPAIPDDSQDPAA